MTLDTIIRVTGEHFGIAEYRMKQRTRDKLVVKPRHVAMYMCRLLTHSSYPDISRAFNRRNHTTAIHACRKITFERARCLVMQRHIDAITRALSLIKHDDMCPHCGECVALKGAA